MSPLHLRISKVSSLSASLSGLLRFLSLQNVINVVHLPTLLEELRDRRRGVAARTPVLNMLSIFLRRYKVLHGAQELARPNSFELIDLNSR